jgi:hypothetical protein
MFFNNLKSVINKQNDINILFNAQALLSSRIYVEYVAFMYQRDI